MKKIFSNYKDYNLICISLLSEKFGRGHYERCKEIIKFNNNNNKLLLINNNNLKKKNLKNLDENKITKKINSFNLNYKKTIIIFDVSNKLFLTKKNLNIINNLIKILKIYKAKLFIIDSINKESLLKYLEIKIDKLII